MTKAAINMERWRLRVFYAQTQEWDRGLYGRSSLSFLRNFQTDFYNDCTNAIFFVNRVTLNGKFHFSC